MRPLIPHFGKWRPRDRCPLVPMPSRDVCSTNPKVFIIIQLKISYRNKFKQKINFKDLSYRPYCQIYVPRIFHLVKFVSSDKCQFDQVSVRPNIRSAICPFSKIPFGRVYWPNAFWPSVRLAKCPWANCPSAFRPSAFCPGALLSRCYKQVNPHASSVDGIYFQVPEYIVTNLW